MNTRARVDRLRAGLGVAVIAYALLWALGAYLLGRLLARLASSSSAPTILPILAGVAAALVVLWRTRGVRRREAVALWLEERAPALRYALVTAAEQPDTANAGELERAVAAEHLAAPIARVLARAFAIPIAVLVVALVVPVFAPSGALRSANAPAGHALDALRSRTERLAPLAVTITPPAYSGIPARTLADPSGIAALVASAIVVSGPGSDSGLYAMRGDTALRVEQDGGRWRVRFPMPPRAMALRLTDGARDRLIVLEPQADSAPVVTLLAPLRDTVLREPDGDLSVRADVRDDFGVGDAWLEYIISSGEGESFTFRNGVIARVDARGARVTALAGVLHLGALGLKPGDILHVRGVARDLNDASGPDTGASETRTIRIARKGEYDSVAVEGAPPPDADKSLISERMLIIRAEALERQRATLAHRDLTDSSVRIARDQARLRKQVSRVIFARLGASAESEESQQLDDSAPPRTPDQLLAAADSATNAGATALDFEGDETPVVAVNRTLLEAYEAMWEAERRLQVADPGGALPFMRAALAAIQRARAAERLYLRGRPPNAVVDVAHARLAGKRDDAAGAARTPRTALDTTAARRAQRFEAALALIPNVRAAEDSLSLLRVDAIAQDPSFAAALGALLDSLHTGGNLAVVLPKARRAAAGVPGRARGGAWEGAW